MPIVSCTCYEIYVSDDIIYLHSSDTLSPVINLPMSCLESLVWLFRFFGSIKETSIIILENLSQFKINCHTIKPSTTEVVVFVVKCHQFPGFD